MWPLNWGYYSMLFHSLIGVKLRLIGRFNGLALQQRKGDFHTSYCFLYQVYNQTICNSASGASLLSSFKMCWSWVATSVYESTTTFFCLWFQGEVFPLVVIMQEEYSTMNIMIISHWFWVKWSFKKLNT